MNLSFDLPRSLGISTNVSPTEAALLGLVLIVAILACGLVIAVWRGRK